MLFCIVLLLKGCSFSLFLQLVNLASVISIWKQQPRRSYHYYLCRLVGIFLVHRYMFVVFVCLCFGVLFLFLRLFLCYHIYKYVLFVVCSFAVFLVLCNVSFEKLLFVIDFSFLSSLRLVLFRSKTCCLSLFILLFNLMFVISICKQQPRRSYHYSFCSTV